MTELLIEPARSTGCPDLNGLSEVILTGGDGTNFLFPNDLAFGPDYMASLYLMPSLFWLPNYGFD